MVGCFGFFALAYLSAGIPIILVLIKMHAHIGKLVNTRFATPPTQALMLFVVDALLLSPIVLGSISGVAWLLLKTGKRGARLWPLAASGGFLLAAAILTFCDIYINRHDPKVHPPFALLIGVQMFLGFGGLIAFGRPDSNPKLVSSPKSSGIPGDCTNRLLDVLALPLGIGGVLVLLNLYGRWGWQQGLHFSRGIDSWVQWGVVLAGAILVHESGHAIFGVALGMKLRAFIIGPFQFHVVEGRWTFEFRLTQIMAVSGAAGLAPVDPEQSRWNEITMIAAGPLSNLFTGVIAAAFAYSAVASPWRPFWDWFALFASVSLVTGIINLLPIQAGVGMYSDGASILQLMGNSSAADYHRAMATVTSTLVSPRRPRDFDIAAINRASAQINSGQPALLLRLWATHYHQDVGAIADASASLAHAERIYADSASDIPARLHTPFIIGCALLRKDAAGVRHWWQQMQSKKPDRQNGDYWLARCAFHWAEGDIAHARESFERGKDYVSRLPNTGVYNFDRDCYSQMEAILNEPPHLTAAVTDGNSDRSEHQIATRYAGPLARNAD